MSAEKPIKKIVIVGAGPSGLTLGIMLAKQGIDIELLDMSTELDKNPRAAHYAPSSVIELRRAGVLDDVRAQGFTPEGVCWREIDGKFLAGISQRSPEENAMVVLPLDRLGKVLLKHFEALPNTQVKWSHKVVGIDQDEKEARVQVETPEGKKTISGDYVLGCDGANSQIRKSLFGDMNYPGETLGSQIIATNVYYDFTKFDYWDSNFIVHPTDWYMAARITTDGMWRVTYGDIPGLSTEEYIKRQPMRYEQILPGKPKPGDYKLVGMSPYKLQQRCAPSFRVGRFLLVADAAHLCNPFGGMGLTGGFADVGSLYDCLMGIQNDLTDDSILDKYSEVRRNIWAEIIDPMSRANFNRLWREESIPERKQFFDMCDKTMKDPEFAKQMQRATYILNHDMSQYFTKKTEPVAAANGMILGSTTEAVKV